MSALPHLYSDLARWGVIEADTLALLPKLPSGSIDAVVTDPPYGIDFGGMAWDGKHMRDLIGGRGSAVSRPESFEHFTYMWAIEALRILKPGGHLISFGSPRTAHRMIAAIEDVGFEVRDQLMWMYASGVPKSRRYPDGGGSALKPAYEPILLARKKPAGTLAGNQGKHGTGLLEIEACRIIEETGRGEVDRWPANVTYSHSPGCDVVHCEPECPEAVMDRHAPEAASLSRIFYSTKAQRMEREAGLDGLPKRNVEIMRHTGNPRPKANVHQTVKPIALMRWLARLVAPPGGVVLDPFAGSGSTGIASVLEGRQFLGIEKEPEYVRIAHHRIRHWLERGPEVTA